MGAGLLFSALGCNSIIGVSDLPPAMNGDAGERDAPPVDATGHDGTLVDAAHTDAPAAHDAKEAGPKDAKTSDAQPPTFEVSPTALAFGDAGGKLGFVACGSMAAPTRRVSVVNHGAAALSWWASLGLGAASPYKLSTSCTASTPCTIEAGDASTLEITITGPVAAADAGIATYSDTLTLFSTATGEPPTNVALQTSSYGAVVAFSQTDVNFGQQPENQPDGGYPQGLELENSGNAPFAGTLHVGPAIRTGDAGASDGGDASTGSGDFVLSTAPHDASPGDGTLLDVPASSGTGFTVSFNPAGTLTAASGSLIVGSESAGGLCAALPAPVSLEGQGTKSPISVTSSLNFNNDVNGNGGIGISCGLTASAQSITITNASMTPATVKGLTLGLGAASPFTVPATTPTITIPAASVTGPGSVTIPITPNAIPKATVPGTVFNDALTVVTSVAGDLPHLVQLEMTAAGVVLTVAATSVVVSTTPVGHVTQQSVYVTNTGNINTGGGQLTTSMTNPVFVWQDGQLNAYEPNPQPFRIQFDPTAAETYTGVGTLVLGASVPICSPPNGAAPPFDGTLAISITGTGATSPYYNAILHELGFVMPCAALGATPTNLTFTDVLENKLDPNPVRWTAALTGPDASYFTLSATGGMLTGSTLAGPTANLTVTALGLSSTSGLSSTQAAFGLNGMLTVTFFGMDTEIYTMPILEQPQGTYLVWSPSALDVPLAASSAVSLFEWDNYAANVTLASGSPSLFPVQLVGGSASRIGRPLNALVGDSTEAIGEMTTLTATVSGTTTPMCGPPPAPLSVTVVAAP
jgi:hypothetical protein